MRGTRSGGSPRARSRSKSARRPLCANLTAVIVSRSGTFHSAAKSPGACQPAAERLRDAVRPGAEPATRAGRCGSGNAGAPSPRPRSRPRSALAAYFGEGPSELRAIAEDAERRIGLPLDRGPPASAPDSQPAENDHFFRNYYDDENQAGDDRSEGREEDVTDDE